MRTPREGCATWKGSSTSPPANPLGRTRDERQRQGAARSCLRAEAPRPRQEERPAQQEEAAQSSALIVAIILRDNHEWRTAHHITGQKVNGMNDNNF